MKEGDNKEFSEKKKEALHLEKETLKRLKSQEKKEKKEKKRKEEKDKDKDEFIKNAKKSFSKHARKLTDKGYFSNLEEDMAKANLPFTVNGYVSAILYITIISLGLSFFIMLFLLFFNVMGTPPFITIAAESIGVRLFKVIWIPIVVPVLTFAIAAYYPRMEKKSKEKKINKELPLATLHMSAISGSMVNPSEIFKIIISTKEYPNLEKEFIKLMNQINIHGVDFVTALRDSAKICGSDKLAEMYNSLATNIRTGGDLPKFFNKRADSLLFEHKTEQKKEAKSAETFMNIYISVVITAPLILMLLLMMMKISGLGIQLSSSQISLIMVLGVVVINIAFLVFLHVRK